MSDKRPTYGVRLGALIRSSSALRDNGWGRALALDTRYVWLSPPALSVLGWLRHLACTRALGQHPAELAARADVELGEHLA
jgi:hypothetical protein